MLLLSVNELGTFYIYFQYKFTIGLVVDFISLFNLFLLGVNKQNWGKFFYV